MLTLSPERWQEISPYLDQLFSLPEPEQGCLAILMRVSEGILLLTATHVRLAEFNALLSHKPLDGTLQFRAGSAFGVMECVPMFATLPYTLDSSFAHRFFTSNTLLTCDSCKRNTQRDTFSLQF
jgi:hypothetical protein